MSTINSKIYSILFYIFITVNASTILIDDFSDTDDQQHPLLKGSEIPGLDRKFYNTDCNITSTGLTATENNATSEITYSLSDNQYLKFSEISKLKIIVDSHSLMKDMECSVFFTTKDNATRQYNLNYLKDNPSIDIDLSSISSDSYTESPGFPKGKRVKSMFFINEKGFFKTDADDTISFTSGENYITKIDFIFNPRGDDIGKWTIKSIEGDLVPEPFSIITLGGGITALIRKKKKYHSF